MTKLNNSSATKVLFVCTGNICRSPLAHRMFEKIAAEQGRANDFFVDSCGTHAWHSGQNADKRMRNEANARGWDFEKHAREINVSNIEFFDYIYVMGEEHISEIKFLLKPTQYGLLSKVHLLRKYDHKAKAGETEVPDPYYGAENAFHEAYEMIERCCKEILEIL